MALRTNSISIVNHHDPTSSEQPESVQPDAEPYAATSNEGPSSAADSKTSQPWEVPVPSGADGELSDTNVITEAEWTIRNNQLVRLHHKPRIKFFFPSNLAKCPLPLEWLQLEYLNKIETRQGSFWEFQDTWRGNIQAHQRMPSLWAGRTTFTTQPDHVSAIHDTQLTNLCTNASCHGQECCLHVSH